jgi:hypothetical protein
MNSYVPRDVRPSGKNKDANAAGDIDEAAAFPPKTFLFMRLPVEL